MYYLFFDESGDWTFSEKGTQFLVFTCITVKNTENLNNNLSLLRDEFLTKGEDIERFHASEDFQYVRDKVYSAILKSNDFIIDSVIVEKPKTNPVLAVNQERLYKRIFGVLLKYVLNRYNFKKVIIFTDTLPHKSKREKVKKGIKIAIKHILPDKEFHIYHHSSKAHFCLQIVDYCSWAIYRKWGNWGNIEIRPYKIIKDKIHSEFDLFRRGDGTIYYNRNFYSSSL